MDTMLDSDSGDVGSIPARDTKRRGCKKTVLQKKTANMSIKDRNAVFFVV